MTLLAPFLLLLCLGIGDFGRVLYYAITLSHAARAGAQYGAQSNGTTGDAAGIRQAALEEAQNIGAISVSSQRICECTSGTSVSCTTTSCGSYGVPRVFVSVTTGGTFRTLATWPGIPASVPLSRTVKVRSQ